MRRTTIVAIAVLLLAATAVLRSSGTLLALSQHEVPGRAQRTLTLEQRVWYQRAIEEVYWRHRIWPKENSNPKPSLDAVMSQAQLEKKVKDYLRNSQALADYWQRPITAQQLQCTVPGSRRSRAGDNGRSRANSSREPLGLLLQVSLIFVSLDELVSCQTARHS